MREALVLVSKSILEENQTSYERDCSQVELISRQRSGTSSLEEDLRV
jgi:hypothetical protein